MANVRYDAGANAIWQGNIAWKAAGGSTIKGQLVDAGAYTFSQTHANLSDIASGARIGTAVALTLIDPAAGVIDANDITFLAVPGSTSVEALVVYKDTGTAGTSTLLFYIDTATGLPFTPTGTDVTVQWPNDANKIAKI